MRFLATSSLYSLRQSPLPCFSSLRPWPTPLERNRHLAMPVDVKLVTYDVQDLTPGSGNLSVSNLALDATYGGSAGPPPPCPECCAYQDIAFDPLSVFLPVDGTEPVVVDGVSSCNNQVVDISGDFNTWASKAPTIAQLSLRKVQGLAPGVTTGFVNGQIPTPGACGCPDQQVEPMVSVSVDIPTSETTMLYGTYAITEGVFEMILNPGTGNYDSHYVTESDYATGTDTCYWPGVPITNPPAVAGSTWTVGQSPAGHNQYGLDGIGFTSPGVLYIQQNGAAHGVDFPCTVTFYQEMDYEGDANTFYDYAENVDTQTIGSNTVKVCRAGMCTGTIPF